MSASCGINLMAPSHLRTHMGLWGPWCCDQASPALTLGQLLAEHKSPIQDGCPDEGGNFSLLPELHCILE